MSIQNAGSVIKEARLSSGLSQEKLSDGVCSVLSLSRIENGSAGVSPSTFQALMAHAGVSCEAIPIFRNRTDFDCFYILKRVRFYLDCWQVAAAYNELEKIETLDFAQNKYYYQEWLLLHCKLQFQTGCSNHEVSYQTLLDALHISRPEFNLFDFRKILLSINEIELLVLIAQECLYSNRLEICLSICNQISSYIQNSQLTFSVKDRLLAENAIVYAKYLIAIKDYLSALKTLEMSHIQMIKNTNHSCLHELTFLMGLSHYYLNNTDTALTYFRTTFFSAHSIGSCYATTIYNFIHNTLNISFLNDSLEIRHIPLISFSYKKAVDITNFSDGTYDLFSNETLTIGRLIQQLRTEQKLSQLSLCFGLCSKSKLSKIENGTLQPDFALTQSLLQRLGICDTVFSFYGNEHETMLQDLRLELSHTPLSKKEHIINLTNQLEAICSPKDTIYLQYASYRRALIRLNGKECSDALLNSLTMTIPHFDFSNLHTYSLSWLELTILNNYCYEYCKISPSKGTLYLYKLLEFFENSKIDVLENKRIFTVLLCNLSAVLYEQKRYNELIELAPFFSSADIKSSLTAVGVVFANYAQALGELQLCDQLILFANYAYANLVITNSNHNAILFKNALKSDFNIDLF